jgi:VIT1/CCC1 family predicted Fe2+/Mn2+ transporter
MGEVLFGLIMTLTFTLGAGIVIEEEGRDGVRAMLVGVLGCNLAWGIIDGVLYVLGSVFERGRLRRVGARLRRAGSDAEASRLVAAELDPLLESVADPAQRAELYRAIAARLQNSTPVPNGIRKADLLGGLASGWLVFLCSVPAVLPFLLFDQLTFALRVSNGILLALLFLAGYRYARHTLAQPWLTGLVFLLVGVGLVALAIPLGG